jgi:hypothetical protein
MSSLRFLSALLLLAVIAAPSDASAQARACETPRRMEKAVQRALKNPEDRTWLASSGVGAEMYDRDLCRKDGPLPTAVSYLRKRAAGLDRQLEEAVRPLRQGLAPGKSLLVSSYADRLHSFGPDGEDEEYFVNLLVVNGSGFDASRVAVRMQPKDPRKEVGRFELYHGVGQGKTIAEGWITRRAELGEGATPTGLYFTDPSGVERSVDFTLAHGSREAIQRIVDIAGWRDQVARLGAELAASQSRRRR